MLRLCGREGPPGSQNAFRSQCLRTTGPRGIKAIICAGLRSISKASHAIKIQQKQFQLFPTAPEIDGAQSRTLGRVPAESMSSISSLQSLAPPSAFLFGSDSPMRRAVGRVDSCETSRVLTGKLSETVSIESRVNFVSAVSNRSLTDRADEHTEAGAARSRTGRKKRCRRWEQLLRLQRTETVEHVCVAQQNQRESTPPARKQRLALTIPS